MPLIVIRQCPLSLVSRLGGGQSQMLLSNAIASPRFRTVGDTARLTPLFEERPSQRGIL